MSDAAKKFATYDDVLAAPVHRVAELVAGELHTQPRPASRHARASTRLVGKLDAEFGGPDGQEPGGWILLIEPELHLSSDVLVPDLGGWRRERMPEMPDVAFFELAPDFCCEVLSPSTARFDRATKLPIYASHGVGHVWLVDPLMETLEVYALDGATYRLLATHAQEEVVEAPPFEAVPLELARLWSR